MSMTTGEHDAYMRGVAATYKKAMQAITTGMHNNQHGEGITWAYQAIHRSYEEDLKQLGDNR